MKPKSARFTFHLLFTLILLASSPSEALEVKEARWGLNDGVKLGHFNPVYALLYNDSKTENFDGEVILRPGLFGPIRGVVEKKKVFLAPRTSRWIQFGPMINSTSLDWKIQWGSGPKDWFPMPDVISEPTCWLVLYPKESELTKIQGFQSRLDSFWPASVALTAGVDSVFLDHAPDWNADQEKSFLDWLHLGGKVHILKGRDSSYPKFSRRLKILNSEEPFARLGAGTIIRQSFQEFRLRIEAVEKAPMPFFKPTFQNSMRSPINHSLLEELAEARPKPKHRWTLIFSLCFIYLFLVGPINFLLARKTKSYRPGLLFLVGSIAIFTMVFYFLGRRGYEENTLYYKVEYARSLGDGQFDVQSWNHLFVVDSGEYTLKQNSSMAFYGSLDDEETMLGQVENGLSGQFTTKIPLFSTRSYLAQHRLSTKKFFGAVVKRDHGKNPQFEIKLGPGFPKGATAWILHDKRVYHATVTDDRLVLQSDIGGIRSRFVESQFSQGHWYRRRSELELWRELKRSSISVLHDFSLELDGYEVAKEPKNLDIHIIVRAKSPDEWSIIDFPNPHKSITYFQFTFPHEKR